MEHSKKQVRNLGLLLAAVIGVAGVAWRRHGESPEYQAEQRVAEATLDLGQLQLRRAQALTDPAARRAALEQAEKTFLAIRGAAGKSPEFQLDLGQVYYWLGKNAEGRQLFDEFLAAANRSATALFQVALVLRQVGAVGDAKAFLEEAYSKESDSGRQQQIAAARAAMRGELDDEILWLSRADTAAPVTSASLARARGEQAQQEGRLAEAVKQYRRAIAIYEQAPESFVTLNNLALIYLSLYRATGDADAPFRATALLDKALTLRPGDTILIENIADQALHQALADLLKSEVDLPLLREQGALGMLEFLYHDEAGRAGLIAQLGSHPDIARARAHHERVLLLAPKNVAPYIALATLHLHTRDADGLRALDMRLQSADVDHTELDRQQRDELEGNNDAKRQKLRAHALAQSRDRLEAARSSSGPTFAVAAAAHIHDLTSGEFLGDAAPAATIVALAEEAYRRAPSHGSRWLLVSALLHRAHQELSRNVAAYTALADKGKRTLNSANLIAIALARDDALRTSCLAHADVQRALDMLKQDGERFPSRRGEWSWALLRAAHPAEAACIAAANQNDEVNRLGLKLLHRLLPDNVDIAYRTSLALQMAGRDAEADGVLRQLASRGIPLPGY